MVDNTNPSEDHAILSRVREQIEDTRKRHQAEERSHEAQLLAKPFRERIWDPVIAEDAQHSSHGDQHDEHGCELRPGLAEMKTAAGIEEFRQR